LGKRTPCKILADLHPKVAIYKYHTNEFVYKNEGVGAMSEQSDQIGKIFTHTEKFLAKNWCFS
jgi:hypothetical protein